MIDMNPTSSQSSLWISGECLYMELVVFTFPNSNLNLFPSEALFPMMGMLDCIQQSSVFHRLHCRWRWRCKFNFTRFHPGSNCWRSMSALCLDIVTLGSVKQQFVSSKLHMITEFSDAVYQIYQECNSCKSRRRFVMVFKIVTCQDHDKSLSSHRIHILKQMSLRAWIQIKVKNLAWIDWAPSTKMKVTLAHFLLQLEQF